ncbi:MAG: DNA primase [Proteobacteria bacterium]|nr:DNA primase [Pseudomonadota bacterium]
MLAEKIITQLDGVKTTGQDRWIARCPSHEDRSPSLAIREVDDRLLLHCFAGCSANEIVSAVGLDLSDLFPESRESHKPLSRPFPASDILKCLSFESLFISVCAEHLAQGKPLTDDDRERIHLANRRIRSAIQVGGIA